MNTSWATRPLFTLPPSVSRLFTGVTVLLVIFLIFSPGLVAVGWHLFHGNTIQSRDKIIHVPLRWVAETTDAWDVLMLRLPVTILRGVNFDGIISVGRHFSPSHKSTDEIYRAWESGNRLVVLPGAVVSPPLKSGSGPNEMFCMEMSYPQSPNRAAASCLILQGTWRADFWGEKSDQGTFFEIIRQVK